MSKSNDVTGDRITNALKGNKEKYREGWEAIFGSKKKSLEEWAEDAIETVEESEDVPVGRLCGKETDKILDEITQDNEEMGVYDENS